MKQFILFAVIFGLGALAFALFDMYFAPKAEAPVEVEEATTTQAVVEQQTEETQEEPLVEDEVVITEDGSLLDGPFVIFDADGQETEATVRQIISPEERLLQFANFDMEYALASRIYLADNKEADSYLNLGPAQMNDDYLVYGIPLDADLTEFNYVLIYDEQRGETEYYARIK